MAFRIVPGGAFDEIEVESMLLRDCKLAAKLSAGEGPGALLVPFSARSEAINCDMPVTKSCFETAPVPLGSREEKIASDPCC